MRGPELCLGPGWGIEQDDDNALQIRLYNAPMERQITIRHDAMWRQEQELTVTDSKETLLLETGSLWQLRRRRQQLSWQPLSFFDELKMAQAL